jgi:hypothetical protein
MSFLSSWRARGGRRTREGSITIRIAIRIRITITIATEQDMHNSPGASGLDRGAHQCGDNACGE